jgi:selenide,water dikinase
VFGGGVPEERRRLVCDATTSGGLLVAVAPERAAAIPGVVVGEIVAGEPGSLVVL